MELKKIREIRSAKEYLPGFAGGFDPVVPGFGGWKWGTTGFEIQGANGWTWG